jgi:two-component system response regulator HydG
MQELYDVLERAAATHASVLISGENGTGKRLLAHAIHDEGRQCAGPYLELDCKTIDPATLSRALERAAHGTLVLEDVTRLGDSARAALLRFLDTGPTKPRASRAAPKARLICITADDSAAGAQTASRDEGLLSRLGAVRLHVPPLRARGADVVRIAERFIARFAEETGKTIRGLEPEAVDRLIAYGWPGNVEELRRCMEDAVVLSKGHRITRNDLPDRVLHARANPFGAPLDVEAEAPTEELERRYVLKVVDAVGGSHSAAASMLGIGRQALREKLERYRGR